MKALVFTLFLVELSLIGVIILLFVKFDRFKRATNKNIDVLKEGLKTHKNSINRLNKTYEDMQKAIESAYDKLDKVYSNEKNGNRQDIREIMNALLEMRKITKK